MASVMREKNGGIQIQFYLGGKRRSIRLGKTSEKSVALVKYHVERLVEAHKAGVDAEVKVAKWLQGIDDQLHSKIAKTTLIAPRVVREVVRLGTFAAEYVAKRQDVKAASKTVWRQGERSLVKFFKAERPVDEISAGDADDYKQWLLGEKVRDGKTKQKGKLASYTVRKRLQFAKMLFKALVKRKLIATNPFDGVQVVAVMDKARSVYVSRGDVARVVDACPDAEWRAIVALSRFGGLRCPSETLSLKWEHIDWHVQRITVISPKTEHHPDGGQREIPLFAELVEPLREAFEAAPEGAVFIVSRHRSQADVTSDWRATNLRSRFENIIAKAGLKPWPRLFHALRASCETDLLDRHIPIQAITTWLGNSPKVALKHYLKVLPEHFDKVIEKAGLKAGLADAVTSGTTTNAKPILSSVLGDSSSYDLVPTEKRMGWDSNPR